MDNLIYQAVTWLISELNEWVQGIYSKQQDIMTEIPAIDPIDTLNPDWTLPKDAYHNVRVLCDLAGLTFEEKNLICACIFQESRFNNAAICRNKNALGVVTSSDWGLVQVNDHYHIGPKLDFPSVEYVLANPDVAVNWMIAMYKHNLLSMWVSYSSGAYRQWLATSSPMWALSTR